MEDRHTNHAKQVRTRTSAWITAKNSHQSRRNLRSEHLHLPAKYRTGGSVSSRWRLPASNLGRVHKQHITQTDPSLPKVTDRVDCCSTGPAEDYKATLDDQIHDAQKNQKLRNYLLYAMRQDPRCKKYVAKVESCGCGVRIEAGVPKVQRFSCGFRFCPTCYTARNVERRAVLKRVFYQAGELVNKDPLIHPQFLTLTIDSKRKGVPQKNELKLRWLRKKLTQFLNQRWSKAHIKGSVYRIEATWGPKARFPHFHIHLAILSDLTQQKFDDQVRQLWTKMGGGFIKNKKWRVEDLFLELTKGTSTGAEEGERLHAYLHKPFDLDLSVEKLNEIVVSFQRSRVRTTGSTGILQKWIKQAKLDNKKEREEEATADDMPTPPKDVPALKDGYYSKLDLMVLSRAGNAYAKYVLTFLEWWKKRKGSMTREEATWWKVWSKYAPR